MLLVSITCERKTENIILAGREREGVGEPQEIFGSNFFSIFPEVNETPEVIIARTKILNHFKNSKVKAGWRSGIPKLVIKRNASFLEHKQT